MKVEIWGNVRGGPGAYKLWSGELSVLPRPDDAIDIREDYGSLYVRSVTIEAYSDSAVIDVWINKDDVALYAAEVEE